MATIIFYSVVNHLKKPIHPNINDINLTSVLYALSDPTRLDIVVKLAKNSDLSCGSLALSVPKSTLSHHLKVLRESGIINVRIEGTQHFLSLRNNDLDIRFSGLLSSILDAASYSNLT